MVNNLYYNNFLKWWQTIKVNWIRMSSYRMNFFLQVISPSIVFFFIKYNLWTSVYQGSQTTVLAGFTLKQMIFYHLWVLIISIMVSTYSSDKLSEDIRLGKISTYLIYPFNFWEFHTASFLSFQAIQTLISIITIGVLWSSGILHSISISILSQGLIYCFVASFFWYSIQYLTAIMAFWLEETWILRVIFMIIKNFLSGSIIPLSFFPETFVEILKFTPFPYMIYYPVKIFMGEISLIGAPLIILILWTTLIIVICHFVWKRGIKLYEAAGI